MTTGISLPIRHKKVYDDIELDHYGNSSRHFHWEAETEYDEYSVQ